MSNQKISARTIVTEVPVDDKIPLGTTGNPAITPRQIASLVIPGAWDATTNAFPTVREDGGPITRGYQFDIVGNSTTLHDAHGDPFLDGGMIRAKVDSPGSDPTKWKVTYG